MPSLPAGRLWPALTFLAALAAAFWRMPVADAPAFVPPPAPQVATLPAFFVANPLPRVADSAGAASLARLPDGRLAAAWLAGPHDRPQQGAIWFSLLDAGGWQDPWPIANRESTAGSTFAHVRRIGNPVLHAEGDVLHLWFDLTGIAGWAGSGIAHARSDDGGQTWRKARRLPISPLAAAGGHVAAPPLRLADGGLGLPITHQLFAGHGEWLRLNADGRIIDKARLTHPQRTGHPAIVALDEQRALALLRDASGAPGQVQRAETGNGGLRWTAGESPGLPNPDTPLALLRLHSGRLLLAGNPQDGPQALHLWLSKDSGRSWTLQKTIESAADGAAAFTAPSLLAGPDGRIHLAYTWRGQAIRYASFSEAWLDGGQP